MKARTLSLQLAGFAALALVIYVANAFVGHPIEVLQQRLQPVTWAVYDMPKYGVAVDIPQGWRMRQDRHGIVLEKPSGGVICFRAITEETSYHHLPIDEYAFERLTDHHPYFKDSVYTLRRIVSADSVAGIQFNPVWSHADSAPVVWAGPTNATPVTVSYFPSLFSGDSNTMVIELVSVGAPPPVYDHMVRSFHYGFKTLSQSQLLEQRLIAYSEIPDRSVAYVGETRGFLIDVDGDSTEELLIAGMRRTVELSEDKCFFRLMKKTGNAYVRVLEQYYLENSFQDTDIKIVNLDDQPGFEVFLRFYDYGNEWGSHSTTFIYHTDKGFRFTEMGAFAEPRDINGDGIDEVIKSVNTHFGPGVMASWYDIYCFENGELAECDSRFPLFYRDVVLPKYAAQMEQARNEMNISSVQKFRVSVSYMLRRLQRYMKRAQLIANGHLETLS